MAKVEIDEAQYAAQQRLTALYQGMMANPKAREQLYAAAKLVDPNLPTPELDAKGEIIGEIQKRDEEIAALKKRMDDDAAAREQEKLTQQFAQTWDAKRARLREQGYTSDGIEKIEKLAEERGIVDLDAAAALFDKQNPPASLSHPGGGIGSLDLFQQSAQDDEDFKKLLESQGDNPAAETAMINKALIDYRSGRA